jgi:outer membrane lipoprotein-sorting protein
MRKTCLAVSIAMLFCARGFGQCVQPPAPAKTQASTAPAGNLDSVLAAMDAASGKFKSAEATLTSEQYQKVVDETDTQKGTVYFQRHGADLEMMLNITQPDTKYVLVKGDKAQLYQPSIDQVTEYNVAGNREDVEGMFALGFGGKGHDLLKSFQVKLLGNENVDGIATSKLELTPKSPKVHNMFSRITLWIDPARDVSLLQQFDEPSGDWRKAHYSEIKLNQHINGDVFKLNTTSKTKVVKPQG